MKKTENDRKAHFKVWNKLNNKNSEKLLFEDKRIQDSRFAVLSAKRKSNTDERVVDSGPVEELSLQSIQTLIVKTEDAGWITPQIVDFLLNLIMGENDKDCLSALEVVTNLALYPHEQVKLLYCIVPPCLALISARRNDDVGIKVKLQISWLFGNIASDCGECCRFLMSMQVLDLLTTLLSDLLDFLSDNLAGSALAIVPWSICNMLQVKAVLNDTFYPEHLDRIACCLAKTQDIPVSKELFWCFAYLASIQRLQNSIQFISDQHLNLLTERVLLLNLASGAGNTHLLTPYFLTLQYLIEIDSDISFVINNRTILSTLLLSWRVYHASNTFAKELWKVIKDTLTKIDDACIENFMISIGYDDEVCPSKCIETLSNGDTETLLECVEVLFIITSRNKGSRLISRFAHELSGPLCNLLNNFCDGALAVMVLRILRNLIESDTRIVINENDAEKIENLQYTSGNPEVAESSSRLTDLIYARLEENEHL